MRMIPFDQTSARETIAILGLSPSNRAFADYWLSLWSGHALPRRDAINPAKLKALLPNLLILDVVPDRSVTVRLAGTTFNEVLGLELTRQDWLALAPPEYRAERLRIFSDIALGAIGRGMRRVEMDSAEDYVCEELLLPFAAEDTGEVRPVICHLDWKTRGDYVQIKSREQATGAPLAFEVIPLLHFEQDSAIAG